MKKYLSIIILILFSCVLAACGKDPSITYSRKSISINMGYNYVISSSDIELNNTNSEYEIISLNEDIVTVSGHIITPQKVGETGVRIQLIDNTKIHFDIKVIVTNISYAESAVVDQEKVYVNINSDLDIFNPITLSEGCNEVPELIYNSDIISYDYVTGKIVPKALGETSVVVLFRDCNVSFRVYVIDKVFTKSIVMEDCTLLEGYEGKFGFKVFPDNANTYNFFTTSNLLTVSSEGYYKTLEEGEAVVYCEYTTSLESAPVMINFNVTIISNISDFDVSVVNPENEQKKQYIFVEQAYRLRLGINNIDANNIKIVGDINFESEIRSDDKGIYVDFYFKNTGANTIQILVSFDGKTNVISKEFECKVNSILDIDIKAKWTTYYQSLGSDGKYHIYITNDGVRPSSLKFNSLLNNVIINEGLKVFDTTNNTDVEIGHTFVAEVVGEYKLKFEVMGYCVGECIIVVHE